jgi:hypothetical protein
MTWRAAAFSHPERRTGEGRKEPHLAISFSRAVAGADTRTSIDARARPSGMQVNLSTAVPRGKAKQAWRRCSSIDATLRRQKTPGGSRQGIGATSGQAGLRGVRHQKGLPARQPMTSAGACNGWPPNSRPSGSRGRSRPPMAMDGKIGPLGRSPRGLLRLVHNCDEQRVAQLNVPGSPTIGADIGADIPPPSPQHGAASAPQAGPQAGSHIGAAIGAAQG